MEEFKQILKGLFITLGVIGIFISIAVIYDMDKAWDNERGVSTAGTEAHDEADSNYALSERDYDDLSIPSVNEKNEYRKMMFGDMPRGTPVVFIGKVDQVVQGNELRVATGTFAASSLQELFFSEVQFVDRHVLISLSASPRALVGDYIAVKGIYKGTVEYKSVLGSIVKVPAITADYYEADSTMSALDSFFAGRLAANKQLREQQDNERMQAAQQAVQLPTVGSEFDPENGVAEEEYQPPINSQAPQQTQFEANDSVPIKQKDVEAVLLEAEAMAKRTDVDRVISQARGRLNAAYQRALDEDPTIEGEIKFSLKILPDGQVESVETVSSSLNYLPLEQKILIIVKGLNFAGGEFEVWDSTYTLNFTPLQ